MDMNLPVIAGLVSTLIFASSTLPMLTKAIRTKDLHSYSLANILLANGGNIVHSVYVFNLPWGPIWMLHTFHLLTTGFMLVWYLRYERLSTTSLSPDAHNRFIGLLFLVRLRSVPPDRA